MVKYVLKIAYRGWAFSGYQRQPDQRTVQGELEKALTSLFGEPIELQAAGRTDGGVHASGQVVSFTARRHRPVKGIVEGLVGTLGPDLAVLEASELAEGDNFHPRFDALHRTYHYRVLSQSSRQSALMWSSNYWCVGPALNPEAMDAACSVLRGEHDFSTFTARSDKPSHVRNILAFEPALAASPVEGSPAWTFTVTANGFLRRMVRVLVATVVEAGIGHLSTEDVKAKLEARDPSRASHPAPSAGLVFASAHYKNDPFTEGERVVVTYRARPYIGLKLKPR